MDEKRHPHVPFPYRICLENMEAGQCSLSFFVEKNRNDYRWLQKVVFPRFLRWFSKMEEHHNATSSHKLIDPETYASLYQEIKQRWGQQIVANWTERTDPQKFVYEDCAIASYLLSFWRKNDLLPLRFCDIGCGNGLLVHLLKQNGVTGYGIDLRKRRIWANFVETDLRERALNPENDIIENADFLIGNHTDELTPWIPIMAARSRSNFFLLPCCPFDFYGRFQKKSGDVSGSPYFSFLQFIRGICLR
ncbi:unnamed protein product [Gongylonema pulchrum]|uniref:tRNA (uracil-O(2)-)-methyltransferase n=1 Tax=Gongylonema pulchrum TaxID=637853 RepID=A0A3P7QX93_9BILA|nr:unnamed protein product [Gongylonema pulchrum]